MHSEVEKVSDHGNLAPRFFFGSQFLQTIPQNCKVNSVTLVIIDLHFQSLRTLSHLNCYANDVSGQTHIPSLECVLKVQQLHSLNYRTIPILQIPHEQSPRRITV